MKHLLLGITIAVFSVGTALADITCEMQGNHTVCSDPDIGAVPVCTEAGANEICQ